MYQESVYTSGKYLESNPTWHVEDSPWKARNIAAIIKRNKLTPKTVCEVGCGAGEILHQLQSNMDEQCEFSGFEISPQAHELSKRLANTKLQFHLGNFLKEHGNYDLILLIDLIEHLEDYYGFLQEIRHRSEFKILHIPLDLSVQTILRPGKVTRSYYQLGHLHYFTKETALRALEHAGYEILDWFYTTGVRDLPQKTTVARLAKPVIRFMMKVNQDMTATLMGDCSLMVLAS